MFIQTTVITMRRDESVKIASGTRELKKAIVKDKYRMPIMEHSIDHIADQLDKAEKEAWLTTLDIQ